MAIRCERRIGRACRPSAIIGGLLLFVLLLASSPWPARSAPSWTPDATGPGFDEVEAAAAHATALHCRTSSCQAILTIHELADLSDDLNGEQNGVPMLAGRPQVAGQRLDHVLLDHPALYGAVCRLGARLLRGRA